jgi:2-polyprenyl-3-methyl-5-hydroxy-6-metoxy-1,4-benzoquinol methylase
MAVQSHHRGAGGHHTPFPRHGALASTRRIANEAARVEELLRKLQFATTNQNDAWELYTSDYEKLHSLNSFGKQIVIRMFRSNPEFQGFKIDLPEPVLKPHTLFLLGTLCDEFDYVNTSPLFGLTVLDVGCGALSEYGGFDRPHRELLQRFYGDHPPIGAEILQILGAQTIGIDTRPNDKSVYAYHTSYKHRVMEFVDIKNWLQTNNSQFDVITCFQVFDRVNFAYYYSAPEDISRFLRYLRKSLAPQGLLYCSTPFMPFSEENRQLNRQVYTGAGLKPLYEGYYVILQPNS